MEIRRLGKHQDENDAGFPTKSSLKIKVYKVYIGLLEQVILLNMKKKRSRKI